MTVLSGGVLLYRTSNVGVEVLIAHPGGPYWRNRQDGAWTIPKGLLEAGEDVRTAAAREFAEETGHAVDLEGSLDLGTVTMKSGKVVRVWATPGDMEPADLVSNTFEAEWPPRSGTSAVFPEIDRVEWVPPERATRLLNPALACFIDRLMDHLTTSP